MLQQRPTAALEDELSCPICFEFFQDPVSLKCQHSFCRGCQKHQRRHSMADFHPSVSNMKLRNIVEAYLQREEKEGNEGRAVCLVRCSIHNKKLRFFCKECEELVCAVCVETELHDKHKHLSVKEGRQIKSEFAKLRQFLRAEEEARLEALEQEESKKTGLLTERINRLTDDMTSLSERISDIQHRMKTDDVSFLQIHLTYFNNVLSSQEKLLNVLRLSQIIMFFFLLRSMCFCFQYTRT
uniref:Uncharacterized protein n=1 Tax=Oncorhynchus kisutch TaxID=8019 RepID=A0A8C7EYK0_ONCKI